ncbi:MAG: type II toxin-antitoxin system HicA family toxin [Clostridiales bacterium]|jgi:predicted RNA binding protein YcfA (HicA-like mRNA interferase family)|nr:type II toxin-antitoxin system HicA family toxin [Clostridiales bacterium]
MNFRETDRILREDGWYVDSVKGSHYHYKHPTKPGKVTIPNHGGGDIPKPVIKSIKKQAGLE